MQVEKKGLETKLMENKF